MFNKKDIERIGSILSDFGKMEFAKELGGAKVLKKSDPGVAELTKAQNIILYSDQTDKYEFERPYLLTTRNQQYLNNTLPENAESAFCILGSTDTVFELIARDVKKIVAVDTNSLQPLIFELKRASFKTLSVKDYEKFLVDTNNHKYLSPDVFETVKKAFSPLDFKTLNFWENLLAVNPTEDLIDYLFRGVGGDYLKTRSMINYLKDKSVYYELRDKIDKAEVKIVESEALTYLKEHNTDTYDYIDITNILLFIYQQAANSNPEKFKIIISCLKDIYDNNLNPGGTFVLDYLFGFSISDLDRKSKDIIIETAKKIYSETYNYLRENFDVESFMVPKLANCFGNNNDTILLTRKI